MFFRGRTIALTGVALGGWFAGIVSDRFFLLNADRSEPQSSKFDFDVKPLPGLPIFGTVSAAVPISKDTGTEVKPLPNEPPPTASRISQIMRFGFPGLDNIRSLDDYVLSYDKRNKTAHWVFEHLNAESVQGNSTVDRSKCEFVEDSQVHPYFRSSNSDYKGSGYDRGHLAAAGNHKKHQTHCQQTFLLSNMAPQVGKGFNRDSWNRLEKHVRSLTKHNRNVYVCTGPLYLPRREPDGNLYVRYRVIGRNHVSVPTHFFKVIVAESYDQQLSLEAYVMPNEPIDDRTPLESFLAPPESIERAAGLLFFDKLSKQRLQSINGKPAVWL